MRKNEWKELGLPGLENAGTVLLGKEKKSDAVAKAAKLAEQRRTTQVCTFRKS